VRDPYNRVADKLLDRVDIRELYSVMSLSFDDEHRVEAAAHIARRGPHQRARLLAALDLAADAFEAALAVDVPLDDLDARDGVDEGIADGAWLPLNIELSLTA
jgi:hypothetical protein